MIDRLTGYNSGNNAPKGIKQSTVKNGFDRRNSGQFVNVHPNFINNNHRN